MSTGKGSMLSTADLQSMLRLQMLTALAKRAMPNRCPCQPGSKQTTAAWRSTSEKRYISRQWACCPSLPALPASNKKELP